MDYDQVLDTAIRAAREGGRLALEGLNKPGPIKWKGGRDIVTPSILEAQTRITETIRAGFPDHPILSEESDATPDLRSESMWFVDPLDGSLNYMKGIPLFSVSVGFRHKGLHRVGVVYDPNRDELFHAVRTKGAFLNGRRIGTRWVYEGVEAYQASVVATDWPAQVDKRRINAMIVEIIAGEVVSLQIFGSPALAICYIAAGRLDAYFHLQLQLWDVAAAALILQEAGGTFTNAEGSTWQYSDGGYLATNGIIHGRMLDPIRLARQR